MCYAGDPNCPVVIPQGARSLGSLRGVRYSGSRCEVWTREVPWRRRAVPPAAGIAGMQQVTHYLTGCSIDKLPGPGNVNCKMCSIFCTDGYDLKQINDLQLTLWTLFVKL